MGGEEAVGGDTGGRVEEEALDGPTKSHSTSKKVVGRTVSGTVAGGGDTRCCSTTFVVFVDVGSGSLF